MALILQNDSGSVSDANAYIDVAFFKAYHESRGFIASGPDVDTDIDTAIVRATDYIDTRFNFIGYRAKYGQSTQWPRSNAVNRDRGLESDIPSAVKRATAEYAKIALEQVLNPNPDRDDSGAAVLSRSEAVGPLSESVRFAKAGMFEMPKYPLADRLLINAGLVIRNNQIRRG